MRVLAPSPEVGLQLGTRYQTDAAQFKNAGVMFNREEANKRWVFHPVWNGIVAPACAQFEVTPK